LDGRDGARLAVRSSAGLTERLAHGEVRGAGEPGESFPFREEERSDPLGDGEHDLAMGYWLEHFVGKKSGKDDLPLLCARWAYPPGLARKSQQVLVMARFAPDATETKL
jgi:hypothetical protein